MSQVLVKVTPTTFYYALNHNARRRPQISECCSSAEDITGSVSQEFWRLNPAWDRMQQNEPHQLRLDRFYRVHCHIRVATEANDHQGGFIVLSGELLGLHNIKPGTGDWMMREAVSLGADRLDTFDVPHLIALYTRHGFTEVLRESNNNTPCEPDVVFMRRLGAN